MSRMTYTGVWPQAIGHHDGADGLHVSDIEGLVIKDGGTAVSLEDVRDGYDKAADKQGRTQILHVADILGVRIPSWVPPRPYCRRRGAGPRLGPDIQEENGAHGPAYAGLTSTRPTASLHMRPRHRSLHNHHCDHTSVETDRPRLQQRPAYRISETRVMPRMQPPIAYWGACHALI